MNEISCSLAVYSLFNLAQILASIAHCVKRYLTLSQAYLRYRKCYTVTYNLLTIGRRIKWLHLKKFYPLSRSRVLFFLSAFLPAKKVSATPASEWEAHGYPVSEWPSDNSNFHNIGFVNDPKTKIFKVFIEMNPYTEKNHNGTWGYSKLMP